MPLRDYNPLRRSPVMTRSTFEEITTRALQAAPRAPEALLRPEQRRPAHRPPSRRREKRHYRRIDFKRDKFGVPARLATIEYDPNRSARIGLLHYRDGEKRYMLLPHGLKVGDVVVSGPEAEARSATPAAREHPARHHDP